MPHQGRCEWRRTTTPAEKREGRGARSTELRDGQVDDACANSVASTYVKVGKRTYQDSEKNDHTTFSLRPAKQPKPNPDHDRSDEGPDSEVDFMCACPAASTTTPVKGKARGAHDDEKGPDDEGNAHEGSGKNAKRSKASGPRQSAARRLRRRARRHVWRSCRSR